MLKAEMASSYHWADVPYLPYLLSNNNANIKRTRDRLEGLKKVKEAGSQETECEFCKVVENTEIMRLQLIFDGKPEPEVRNILKSNGFTGMRKDQIIVITISGRGDKDCAAIARYRGEDIHE